MHDTDPADTPTDASNGREDMTSDTATGESRTREVRIDAALEARYERTAGAWTLKATRVMGGEWRRRNSVSRTMRYGGAPRMVTPADALWARLEGESLTPPQCEALERLGRVSEPGAWATLRDRRAAEALVRRGLVERREAWVGGYKAYGYTPHHHKVVEYRLRGGGGSD